MICLVDLPPPVHGMSAMNSKFIKLFENKVVINTAPSFASNYFGKRIWILFKLIILPKIYFLILFYRLKGHKYCYRSINGGVGQFFDLTFILLLRILGVRTIIHHHSFNYLSRYNKVFRVLAFILRKDTIHIVLGAKMKDRLIQLYSVEDSSIQVISNVALFETVEVDCSNNTRQLIQKPCIGYLSNLTYEKGVGIYIETCLRLHELGYNFRATIAGPIRDKGLKKQLKSFCEIDGFDYVGPVYSEDKKRFLETLDLFLFPSMYRNEAEPLVIYEAASYGAVTISSDVGCLSDVVQSLGGEVVNFDSNFEENILKRTRTLLERLELIDKFNSQELMNSSILKNRSVINSFLAHVDEYSRS